MHADIEAVLQDFLNTLEEVTILVSAAESSVADEVKYAVYNKSALLLLSGKFENYIESVAEQYVFVVNQLNLPANRIPDILRLHHALGILSKVDLYRNNGRADEIKKIFSEVSSIWITELTFNSLKIDCKFTYGKHGENELKKLFVPLGIEDVFVRVKVFVPEENLSDGLLTTREVDFKGVFNSVMGMRNNILHQNASPNLTHTAIKEYQLAFEVFSKALAQELDSYISALL
jgi:hypothetical protein